MKTKGWALSVTAAGSVAGMGLLLLACARDRGLEMPPQTPGAQAQPGPNVAGQNNGFNPTPTPLPSPSAPHGAPAPTLTAPPAPKATSTGLPPAALPPLDPPPAPSASAPKVTPAGSKDDGKAELAELFRAQDQCLSSCDQFACMKIAAAYKKGATVPKDPLAGRRYALHACQECGLAGPGIADQCPEYQLTPKVSP